MKFDLIFSFSEMEEGLVGSVEYVIDLFSGEFIEVLVGYY